MGSYHVTGAAARSANVIWECSFAALEEEEGEERVVVVATPSLVGS